MMRFVKVGRWRLNLATLISIEEVEAGAERPALLPGDVVVSMMAGHQFTLHDSHARELCRAFDSLIEGDGPVIGHAVDPLGRRLGPVERGLVRDDDRRHHDEARAGRGGSASRRAERAPQRVTGLPSAGDGRDSGRGLRVVGYQDFHGAGLERVDARGLILAGRDIHNRSRRASASVTWRGADDGMLSLHARSTGACLKKR
jgi:hypothetical protein